MTLTLRGRWQTRFLLVVTMGSLITIVIGALFEDLQTAFVSLGYILIFGLVWDAVYFYLQSRRWDHDWTPALYLISGIFESIVLIVGIRLIGLPGISPEYGVLNFLFHYWTVWVGMMVVMFGPMRVIFPRWRFRGGQWL
ncbi:MAG: hypothetical protein HC806_03205 [Anaerolineae bacterium]|nr:hypothetical protein [Anaerolineae bacterium]